MEPTDIKTIQLTINEELHSKFLRLYNKRKEGEKRQVRVKVTIQYVTIKILYCSCAVEAEVCHTIHGML